MKLIIGLGNPGEKYRNNRHNVGYMFIDLVKKQNKNISFAKTNVSMNSSGEAVKKLLKSTGAKADDLYVVHDDLDLRLGTYKIQFGIGPKVHNGVNDIEKELGTSDFWRIRIGVDNRSGDNRIPGEDYVLEDFEDQELKIIEEVIRKAANDLYAKTQ